MSEYIINPAWFYWMGVAGNSRAILIVVGTIGTIAAGLFFLIGKVTAANNKRYGDDNVDYNEALLTVKISKPFLIISVLLLLIALFIPSKETLLQMLIAKVATKQNIALTIEGIKEVTDYIIAAFASLK